MQEITQGEYVALTLRLKDPKTKRAFNLTDYDEFTVCVQNASGGYVQITQVANANGSVVTKNADDALGEITAEFYPTDSDQFRTEEELDVLLEIKKSIDSPSKPLRKVFKRALYVEAFDC